jgi:hypothetical protein
MKVSSLINKITTSLVASFLFLKTASVSQSPLVGEPASLIFCGVGTAGVFKIV